MFRIDQFIQRIRFVGIREHLENLLDRMLFEFFIAIKEWPLVLQFT